MFIRIRYRNFGLISQTLKFRQPLTPRFYSLQTKSENYTKINTFNKNISDPDPITIKKKAIDPYILVEKFVKLVNNNKFNEAVQLTNLYSNSSQSVVLWNMIIKEYGLTGNKNKALKAYSDMKKRSFQPNEQTFTALLVGFSRSRSPLAVSEAKEIFDKIPKYIQKPSIIHINTMMLVYASHGLTLSLEEMYQSLPKSGPNAPDVVTYTTILKYHKRKLDDSVKSKLATKYKHPKNNKIMFRDPDLDDKSQIENIHDKPEEIVITIMNIWDDYVEDAINRQKEYYNDGTKETPLLWLDSTIVNTFLGAGASLFRLPRMNKLLRSIIKKVEIVYMRPEIEIMKRLKSDGIKLAKLVQINSEREGVELNILDNKTLN
ncbi:hypothetical protein BB558_006149 [Smittium angustum]|uniref:Pentacotripeptide-repeat region of PRORP domain-containing protein n=1 Tax=Smittium angustum TaxID=133377 RepID=A0A2U1IYK2_SMIAN|nr:hypothetical protein BB558_006149 [Smittium angustum]